MTTYAQLDKLGKEIGFISEMKRRGFVHHKKFCFVRDRHPFYDMVTGQIFSTGGSMRVWVTCWSPAVYEEFDMKEFPSRAAVLTGGAISPEGFPEWHDWPIENQSQTKTSLATLLVVIDRYAIPWFDRIQTADDYLPLFDEMPFWKPGRKEKEEIRARLEKALVSKAQAGHVG